MTGRTMFSTGSGGRDDAPDILIMVTDGTATREADRTESEVNTTKSAGIIIYTVGIGNDVDQDELTKIASKTSVCLSVCPTHAGIVSKQRHVARCSLDCRIAKCV